MAEINFFSEDIAFVLQGKIKTRQWFKETIAAEGYKTGAINVIFCTDDYLSRLNAQYLKHTSLTDIITFDYTERQHVSGDIFISIERVQENADKFKVSFADELLRVMIHGILHLCGYKDGTPEEEKVMRQKEDFYKHIYKTINKID